MNIIDLEEYAKENNIAIIEKDGVEFLKKFIKENNIINILEIGTAIGYSAISMAKINKKINIVTIERDKKLYQKALENIRNFKLQKRIKVINKDALNNIKLNNKFDLIFIDAAKSKSIEFFNIYKDKLKKEGYIVTDNINFHGLREKKKEIKKRRTRQLMNKIDKYIDFLKENKEFETIFIKDGDGISISKRK